MHVKNNPSNLNKRSTQNSSTSDPYKTPTPYKQCPLMKQKIALTSPRRNSVNTESDNLRRPELSIVNPIVECVAKKYLLKVAFKSLSINLNDAQMKSVISVNFRLRKVFYWFKQAIKIKSQTFQYDSIQKSLRLRHE